MRVKARSMREMKGLDGSNPPLSAPQSLSLPQFVRMARKPCQIP